MSIVNIATVTASPMSQTPSLLLALFNLVKQQPNQEAVQAQLRVFEQTVLPVVQR